MLLGVDVGTTRTKAGLFDERGGLIRASSLNTPIDRTPHGATHDPDALWNAVAAVVRNVVGEEVPRSVGVSSMAEAGLLVDRASGRPRTPILAWFDTRSTRQSEDMAALEAPLQQFRRSGLHPSFKYGLSKILWFREEDGQALDDAVWLSVADYIVFRFTGEFATDPTLAARTYAYDILRGDWDEAWIGRLGLELALFPPVLPSGSPAGGVTSEAARATSLAEGTPAAVAGHDHLCAALAAGVTEPGSLLDSIGTAESILVVTRLPALDEAAAQTGLALVPHVVAGRFCWLGGLSSAGGSVEWLRNALASDPPGYDEISREVGALPPGPTDILYYPYLVGSGAPIPDRRARGAFFGLHEGHSRAHLFKAVLQGTGFEAESIRRAVVTAAGTGDGETIAVGGGTQNRQWMQIKADVSEHTYRVPDLPEATSLGAAFTTALQSDTLSTVVDVQGSATKHCAAGLTIEPDRRWVSAYRNLYEQCYLPLRDSVHGFARLLESTSFEGRNG